MRSIFYMPSDDLAGDAKRRVPIPKFKEEGKCGAFFTCLPTTWQVTRSGACRYRNLRRKANAEHFLHAFRRPGR